MENREDTALSGGILQYFHTRSCKQMRRLKKFFHKKLYKHCTQAEYYGRMKTLAGRGTPSKMTDDESFSVTAGSEDFFILGEKPE